MALNPKNWTLKTQEAVAAAVDQAKALSNPELTPDHLMAAIARQDDTIIPAVLSKLGQAPLMVRNNADEKVLTSPYLQKEITVNNSNPISTSGNSNSSSSSSSNATSNSYSGGQSQEQLLKLQQIQQIQDQIRLSKDKIAKNQVRNLGKNNHSNKMVTSTAITLSSAHCIILF
jgi:ATP-dependent Clp protease ATP-binding subunit ClpA